jgi:hypothetical protein
MSPVHSAHIHQDERYEIQNTHTTRLALSLLQRAAEVECGFCGDRAEKRNVPLGQPQQQWPLDRRNLTLV